MLKIAEDLDLSVRFLLAGHLPVGCPHVSHPHRFHARNVSTGVDAARHNADLRAICQKYGEPLGAPGVEEPGWHAGAQGLWQRRVNACG